MHIYFIPKTFSYSALLIRKMEIALQFIPQLFNSKVRLETKKLVDAADATKQNLFTHASKSCNMKATTHYHKL